MPIRLALILGLSLFGAIACDDDDDDDDSGKDAGEGSAPDAAAPDNGDDVVDGKIQLTLTILDEAEPVGVDGFEVCTTDDDATCETSGEDGVVTLAVSAESDVVLHVDKDDYPGLAVLFSTETSDLDVTSGFAFPTQAMIDERLEAAGVSQDSDKGWFACVAGAGTEGGTMSISPEDGDGPLYWVDGLPDASLDAFPAGFGVASFYNLDAGDYDVSLSIPDVDCTVDSDFFAGSKDDSLRIPIEAGRFTWGCGFSCAADVPVTFTRAADTFDDTAACEADDGLEDTTTDCTECTCGACLDEINTCNETAGCLDIIQCALSADCSGDGCYTAETCMATLDGVEGGVNGDATAAATAWGDCSAENCQPDSCPVPSDP